MSANFKDLMVRTIFKRTLKILYFGTQNRHLLHASIHWQFKSSNRKRNKLSGHSHCILVVRIDYSVSGRNMKQMNFWVRDLVERCK